MLELILSWPAIIGIICCIIAADQYEARWYTILLSIVCIAQLTGIYTISLGIFMYAACIYIPIGIGFSVWRYKRYVAAVLRRTQYLKDEHERQATLRALNPAAMTLSIMTWCLTWPFCIVSSLVSDIATSIKAVVVLALRKLYYKIYNAAVKDFNQQHKSGKK